MAYIREYKKGWRVEVEKQGIRRSATFRTKAEAKNWATKIESDILSRKYGNYEKHTFIEAIDKYLNEISPKKKSYTKELLRLNAFKRDYPLIANKMISDVSNSDMATWRDRRIGEVSIGTVLREWNIINNVFTIARKEWGWCGDSPMSNIARPGNPPSRDRRVSPSEIKKICRQLGYVTVDILPRLKAGDSYRVQRGVTASLNHLGGFLLLTTYRMVHFTG